MMVNASYPELYLKMSSFANISQSITNVEQFFLQNVSISRSFLDRFLVLTHIEQCLILKDSREWLVSYGFLF